MTATETFHTVRVAGGLEALCRDCGPVAVEVIVSGYHEALFSAIITLEGELRGGCPRCKGTIDLTDLAEQLREGGAGELAANVVGDLRLIHGGELDDDRDDDRVNRYYLERSTAGPSSEVKPQAERSPIDRDDRDRDDRRDDRDDDDDGGPTTLSEILGDG